MKLYVTQGHEKGIGLEVFFKSCLLMRPADLKLVKLFAYEETVKNTLVSLKLPFTILEEGVNIAGSIIDVGWPKEVNFSQSFTTLELAMKLSEISGVLFTLPTSTCSRSTRRGPSSGIVKCKHNDKRAEEEA